MGILFLFQIELFNKKYDINVYRLPKHLDEEVARLHLEKIGKIKNPERKAYYEAKKAELNEKTFSDYQHVMDVKWEYFCEIYPQERDKVFSSEEYQSYFNKNNDWLVP